ncbi:hypothetical protein ALPR1_08913 [Algoriphagus machipongonensis]|uniref:Uncharacterized protein n=1 Tax=Algoriphagus machipongonensis TaxID=388413 RepID=A3I1R7_9BACT|nr:hypothetical protein ALPR1_08913 [Algoriphagus machipongonensis]
MTLGIGLIGYYIGAFFLFMPFSFLVAFWLLNYLTELRTGKPIIFGTRWNAPKKKRWISGLNTFLVLMLTFTLTFALALLFGQA